MLHKFLAAPAFAMIKMAVLRWREDEPEERAASLAFYAIFSAAPALALLAGLMGMLLGQAHARARLIQWVAAQINPQVASTLADAMEASLKLNDGAAWWAPILGLGVILYASTRFFAQLQKELNRVWGIRAIEKGLIRDFLRERAIALLMVLGLGLLTFASLVLSAISGALMGALARYLPLISALAPWADVGLTILLMSVGFTLLFKVVPDMDVAWRAAGFGGAITSLMFALGKLLLSVYIARFDPGSAFGAAGAILVFLVWIFYSCQLLFLGAELAKAFADVRGYRFKPTHKARWIDPTHPGERDSDDPNTIK